MSSPSLARMTAWERWEMGAVGTAPPATVHAAAQAQSALLGEQAAISRQRQAAQQAGQAEGYAKGLAQGLEEGLAQGQAEGWAAAQAQAQAELEALKAPWLALASSLPRAWQAAEQDVAQDLLALAFTLAQQVLGQSLAVEPAGMLSAVRNLLQAEPAMSGHPKLFLHPDDAALVKEHLAEELHGAGWSLRPDPHLERGGCRVVAASGELDATLPTRWAQVAARLQRFAPAPAQPVSAAGPPGLAQSSPALSPLTSEGGAHA